MKRRKFLMAGLASAASTMIFARSKMLKTFVGASSRSR